MNKTKTNHFYTGRYDRIFKAVFFDENNLYPIKAFLENLLSIPIYQVQLLGNELTITNKNEKVKIVDGFVLVNHHLYIHLELNTNYSEAISRRNFASFASIYEKNAVRGKQLDMEDKFIHIDINFRMGKTKKEKYKYQVMDEEGNPYIKNVELYAYNMDKLKEIWYSKEEEKKKKYKYLIMLDLDKEELEEFVKKEKGDDLIMYYSKKITELNDEERYSPWLTPEEKEEVTRNILRDDAYREGEESGFAKGETQGFAKGEAQGLTVGFTRGEANGERKRTRELALNMLKENLDISLITKITGLSEKTIKKLSI